MNTYNDMETPASEVPFAVETAGPEDNNVPYMYRSTLPETPPTTTATNPVDTFLGFLENAFNTLAPIARETGVLPPAPTPAPAPAPVRPAVDPSLVGLLVIGAVVLIVVKLSK